MSSIIVEKPPAATPVTVDQAKSHSRVTISDDDDAIRLYIAAATEVVEGFLGRSLVQKGYLQTLDNFPYYVDPTASPQAYPPSEYSLPRYATTMWNYSQQIKLLRAPLVQVSRISYVATDATIQNLYPALDLDRWQAATEYEVSEQILDSNGKIQEVTGASEAEQGAASVSGDTEPTWGTLTGATTTDGNLTWTCRGVPTSGDFYEDRSSVVPRIFPSLTRRVWPAALYVPNAVRIHFVAGYGPDGADVPAHFKLAVLMLAAQYYEFREPVSALGLKEIPGAISRLLWTDRVIDLAPTRG